MTEASDWDQSAAAWIASLGEDGDRGRQFVLDAPMLGAARTSGATTALDVGCGEGRFCRMLASQGITATGLDPTAALLAEARMKDPAGTYVQGRAEKLPFGDGAFDLVVTYLSLIDIPDFRTALTEMARVLSPGGTLLIGNLTGHSTATPRDWPEGSGGWVRDDGGALRYFAMDDYLQERHYTTAWAGIRIVNYHRPLSAYMQALLGLGLQLRDFQEPPFTGPDANQRDKHDRAPWFVQMVWQKP